MQERLTDAFIPDDEVAKFGDGIFDKYGKLAKDSSIPSDYFELSQQIRQDLMPELSFRSQALLLLNHEYPTNTEAEIAILYAEAIAAIKYSEENGEEQPDLEYIVGHSVMAEQGREDEIEAVRLGVEEFFRTPDSVAHMLHLNWLTREGGGFA